MEILVIKIFIVITKLNLSSSDIANITVIWDMNVG